MKGKIAVVLAVCLVILSGCLGYKEIDKRSFVVEIGIDKAEEEDKKYAVSVKLAIPSGDPQKMAGESIVLTEEGKTIAEAVRELKTQVEKQLDFGHTKVIVIGEEIATDGIVEMMDWFTRRRDLQQIAYIGVAEKSAKSILEMKPKDERLPGNYLFLVFGDTGTETPFITTNYLFNLRRGLTEYGLDPVLPLISSMESTFVIDNAGVFKEGQMVLKMSKEETMFFNAMEREYPKVELTIEEDGGLIAVNSKVLKFDYKIYDTNGPPNIELIIDMEGIVEESTETIKEESLKEYEKLVEKEVERKAHALLTEFQKENVDPIGFGLRYRATHFGNEEEKWEEWQALYPEIEFSIKATVKLEGTGIIE